jgi:hypothetical protein
VAAVLTFPFWIEGGEQHISFAGFHQLLPVIKRQRPEFSQIIALVMRNLGEFSKIIVHQESFDFIYELREFRTFSLSLPITALAQTQIGYLRPKLPLHAELFLVEHKADLAFEKSKTRVHSVEQMPTTFCR